MEVLIRKAKPEELQIVQDLNHDLFLSDADKDPYLNLNWPYEDGKNYFQKMISGETGICLLAEISGQVVGYLAGSLKKEVPTYRPVQLAELENMFVKSEYRSQGIGEKLATEFLSWAKENGAKRALVSAFTPNTRALKFYARVGFKPYCTNLEADL